MRRVLITLALLGACAVLWFLPGPPPLAHDGSRSEVAEVVSVDDSDLSLHGHVQFGTEHLVVRRKDGTEWRADNELRAQLELDKTFKPGDAALVIVPDDLREGTILVVRDHWRLGWGFVLFALFALLLVGFGGWTGAKALFSFAFSCLAVWKLLIPLTLRGHSPILTCFLTVAVLTALIQYLVAGWTKKGHAAFLGAMLGVVASLGLSAFFSGALRVNGATLPYAQPLLFSGYASLDLAAIFVGAVILASSGAVMDLAMDIASGVAEVAHHNPSLGFAALFGSGLRMGRAVVGTMTTTLLLAYSGSYLTLLMVFAAQGTHPVDFLNSTLVSAELVKTLVGSFGLVLVAPFTSLVAAILFSVRASGEECDRIIRTFKTREKGKR